MKKQQTVNKLAKMYLNTVGIEAIPESVEQLLSVHRLMSKSREFKSLLGNPLFTSEEREKVIRGMSDRLRLSETTVKFVVYLAEQRVIAELPDVVNKITAIYLEKKKRAKAVVVSPVDISGKYEDRLKSSLRNLTGRDVDIEHVVDPSLLGGILVKVGSTMYDSSIKGQLRLLKDDLIKR